MLARPSLLRRSIRCIYVQGYLAVRILTQSGINLRRCALEPPPPPQWTIRNLDPREMKQPHLLVVRFARSSYHHSQDIGTVIVAKTPDFTNNHGRLMCRPLGQRPYDPGGARQDVSDLEPWGTRELGYVPQVTFRINRRLRQVRYDG